MPCLCNILQWSALQFDECSHQGHRERSNWDTIYLTKSSLSSFTSCRSTNSEVGNMAQNSTRYSHLHVTPIKRRNWNMNRRSHSSPLSLSLQFACQRSIKRTNHWSKDVCFLVTDDSPWGSGRGCSLPMSFRISSGMSSQNSVSSSGSSPPLPSSYKTNTTLIETSLCAICKYFSWKCKNLLISQVWHTVCNILRCSRKYFRQPWQFTCTWCRT